jgi:hypothetical protein
MSIILNHPKVYYIDRLGPPPMRTGWNMNPKSLKEDYKPEKCTTEVKAYGTACLAHRMHGRGLGDEAAPNRKNVMEGMYAMTASLYHKPYPDPRVEGTVWPESWKQTVLRAGAEMPP